AAFCDVVDCGRSCADGCRSAGAPPISDAARSERARVRMGKSGKCRVAVEPPLRLIERWQSRGNMNRDAINLADKLATFTERFAPRTVAQYNGNDVMVAKLLGPFHWHKHDDTDDFFLVIEGTLDIELRDRTVTLQPGEMFIVPRGIEHRPVAREELHILLIEPTGTPNTGDKATAAPR